MDLKEAIEQEERGLYGNCGGLHTYSEVRATILAAAKKQLAAEEAQKPKRASLEEIEANLRECATRILTPPGSMAWIYQVEVRAAADILKALRETVVPWLRDARHYEIRSGSISLRIAAEDMLRALGEEP